LNILLKKITIKWEGAEPGMGQHAHNMKKSEDAMRGLNP